jgi:uncharacterized membrane protein
MPVDLGTIIAIAAVLLFYLRLIILQRQKVKRFSAGQLEKKKKGVRKTAQSAASPRMEFRWPLVGLGIVITFIGAALIGITGVPAEIAAWWWVAITAGIAIMSVGIR